MCPVPVCRDGFGKRGWGGWCVPFVMVLILRLHNGPINAQMKMLSQTSALKTIRTKLNKALDVVRIVFPKVGPEKIVRKRCLMVP